MPDGHSAAQITMVPESRASPVNIISIDYIHDNEREERKLLFSNKSKKK